MNDPPAPSEDRMRSIVDHVIDGIITIDERGLIESFNPAAEKIFGYSRDEVAGRNVRILMPEPYHGEHDEYVANYERTGVPRIIGIGREVSGRRKDGSVFPMELAVSEFHAGGRRYFTGIVRDITERKRLEDELHRRVLDLAQADRQKNEFLAMLAHELRNPLAPMRNALYLLKSPGAEAMREKAQGMIERQLEHLVRLVDDLLDISRIISGRIELRRERLDLADVIRRAVETAHPVVDASGHVVDVSHPPSPVHVMGDLVRLAQVLSNLLANAAKYSHRPSRIRVALAREGGEALITVTDQGQGIAPELLPRIFDLFVQGDHSLARSRGGLGIGLTLVQRLVGMHGGTVAAESAGTGRGSRFTVRLPALPAEARDDPADGARRAQAAPIRRRVLVVDDNVDAADSIGEILQMQGHEVRCAYDGPSALATADEFGPDIVVLDIGLPGIDGYEVARRLRVRPAFRAIPIIAVTGYGQDEDRARSKEAGFDEHLAKPVDPVVLQELVAAP